MLVCIPLATKHHAIMKAIPSTIHTRYDGLTFPLRADVKRKIEIPKPDFSNLPSPKDLLDIQQIVRDELAKYFKHVADEIKENTDHIVASIQKIDWTDKRSIMDGLQPIFDFLKPVFDFVKAHPWILIPLLILALELFVGILGFGAEGVVLGMSRYFVIISLLSASHKPIIPINVVVLGLIMLPSQMSTRLILTGLITYP